MEKRLHKITNFFYQCGWHSYTEQTSEWLNVHVTAYFVTYLTCVLFSYPRNAQRPPDIVVSFSTNLMNLLGRVVYLVYCNADIG